MLAFASHYGNDTVIRMRAILSDNGGMSRPLATFADLADWARGAGLQLHGLRVDAQGAEHLPVPWIAHLNPGHFVVVWDMARDHATISDQLHDHQQVPRQEFDRLFSGNALCDRGARPNGLLRHLDFVRR